MENMTFFETKEQGEWCFHPEKELISARVLLLSVFAVRERRGFGLANVSTFCFIPAFPFGSEWRAEFSEKQRKSSLGGEKSPEN